jgi:hypothetical protein
MRSTRTSNQAELQNSSCTHTLNLGMQQTTFPGVAGLKLNPVVVVLNVISPELAVTSMLELVGARHHKEAGRAP